MNVLQAVRFYQARMSMSRSIYNSIYRLGLYTFLHSLRSNLSPSRPLQLWFEAACEISFAGDIYAMQITPKSRRGRYCFIYVPVLTYLHTTVQIRTTPEQLPISVLGAQRSTNCTVSKEKALELYRVQRCREWVSQCRSPQSTLPQCRCSTNQQGPPKFRPGFFLEITQLYAICETGPEGPELEGQQVEKKSKAAQTKPRKLIRRICCCCCFFAIGEYDLIYNPINPQTRTGFFGFGFRKWQKS